MNSPAPTITTAKAPTFAAVVKREANHASVDAMLEQGNGRARQWAFGPGATQKMLQSPAWAEIGSHEATRLVPPALSYAWPAAALRGPLRAKGRKPRRSRRPRPAAPGLAA